MAVLNSASVLHHCLRPLLSPTSSPKSVLLSLCLKPHTTSSFPTTNLCGEIQYSKCASRPSFYRSTIAHSFCSSTISSKAHAGFSNGPLSDEGVAEEKEFETDDGEEIDNLVLEYDEEGTPTEELELILGEKDENALESVELKSKLPIPNLSLKEKKELASYAHGLGDKLKCQMVGKSGFTGNVATSFIETLEANELLKIKIHRTCPNEIDEVVQQLQEYTGSVVVSQIGRTVIIYRPSLTKMKTEENKQKVMRKSFPRKGWEPKPPGRSLTKVRRATAGRRTRTRSQG